MNSDHILISDYFKVHFNIILPPTPFRFSAVQYIVPRTVVISSR
jgi:hypothetical protein